MRALCSQACASLSIPILLSILTCMIPTRCMSSPAMAAYSEDAPDKFTLISLKNHIALDPFGVMSSWNDSLPFCNWTGVRCSRRHKERVTFLNLMDHQLVGSIPASIGNLSFLQYLYLGSNGFWGRIPPEVGRLYRLKYLNLSHNAIEGEIPPNLTSCSELLGMDLTGNKLTEWLGNITSLLEVSISDNHLQGTIPAAVGKMSRLEFLKISGNNFYGNIPPSVYNLTSLFYLDVGNNRLHGEIQPDIGFTLPNLEGLYVGRNSFTGNIPVSLPNATGLGLGRLVLFKNELTNLKDDAFSFMSSLTNCSGLRLLDISMNQFEGELPPSVSNFSSELEWLILGSNQISGKIPRGIESLKGITRLDMSRNVIMGVIPENIGKLHTLLEVDLSHNKISGAIPASFGNISQLTRLSLQENSLQGNIPSSIGSCRQLETLNLSSNNLTGTIPAEVVTLPFMSISFHLARNLLNGPLPQELGNMSSLVELDVSDNRLSGVIPPTLGECIMLERLDLGNNLFEGSIPSSLSALKSLHLLDLGRNKLSGQIPKYLQNFTLLQDLNLSFNNLEGEVPYDGLFRNVSAISVTGNSRLCGGTEELELPPCKIHRKKKQRTLEFVIPLTIMCFLLFACFIISLIRLRKSGSKRPSAPSIKEHFPKVSYFQIQQATDNFSSSNLIGEGSYGSVYKGILGEERMMVAVKVLNLRRKGAFKSFIAECEALRSIRHRNLVKIVTTCSSIDSKGADFKALVYEFMHNGSLDEWLHPKEDQPEVTKSEVRPDLRNLSLVQRLKAALDMALAIDYLHNQCETSIVHGDLKPSNILFDHDMTAHLGDFGLAKFLPSASPDNCSANQSSSTGVKGTVGYVPPEYGTGGKASMPGDVYSFGVLLLEMFTGKRPTDGMFKDGMTLQEYAKIALHGRVEEIVEPSLLQEAQAHWSHREVVESSRAHFHGENVKSSRATTAKIDCLIALLRLGVLCSLENPNERMKMKDVATELSEIRAKFHGERT
ncbi:hypothetical protein BT93_H3662 [Corymbia citriodora subsp. variegata]|nr:hypothetical protein BT93_H3662 [Corymbia citriodora subsp. variegata]KAF8018835.1 hypothetical protein BT93_H3662 [Corymbia citriodora subsp. variegata]KAF8018837.1 hypothetical protein BT93_H3662 [Corymbia citriodora subsp. variegata]